MTVSIWQADGTQPVREVDFLIVARGSWAARRPISPAKRGARSS